MVIWKYIFRLLFTIISIVNYHTTEAQLCGGSWALQRPLTIQCVTGQWIGWQNSGPPTGCPSNPTYSGVQTNTFTFTAPVSDFFIDFYGFDGASQCSRIQIKINDIFYHLTDINLENFPIGSTCTGSFSAMAVTPDGYLVSTSPFGGGQGRINFNGVNANSVQISSNDGAGTVFSNPFNCTSIVPLKLISFTGKSGKCKAELNWVTGAEFSIKNIEVERGSNDYKFVKVNEVNPLGSNSFYSLIVANSDNGFFRLKINDIDGSYEYSSIIFIKAFCKDFEFVVSPNPAHDRITITNIKRGDKVIVLDVLGRVQKSLKNLQNLGEYDIQYLFPGAYIFQVITNGILKDSFKVIKH